MISFGLGLDTIVGAFNPSRFGESTQADLSVRLLAMGFVLIGIVAMAAATRQHQRHLRLIRPAAAAGVDGHRLPPGWRRS